jgi:hypothetical protein
VTTAAQVEDLILATIDEGGTAVSAAELSSGRWRSHDLLRSTMTLAQARAGLRRLRDKGTIRYVKDERVWRRT